MKTMSFGDSETFPLVTVIMPVFNEEAYIERSLGAVLEQDYPRERMEVLVVDGRSADRTRDHVEQISLKENRVKLLDNPHRDQASAMNVGLDSANGSVIIRVDGHSAIPEHYISSCVRVMQDSGADNVGGQMRAVGSTGLARAIALATSSPFGTGGARFHSAARPGEVETVYLGAFDRRVFDMAGRFDPAAVPNEDYELNFRIRERGGRVYYSPEIWSSYFVRSSLPSLAHQYFRYGWRKAFVIRRHPASAQLRQLVAPLFVLSLVAGLAGAWLSLWIARALAVLVGGYLLVDALASLWLSALHGWPNVIYLPVIFPTLHLTWGAGFLAGLLAQLAGRKT